MNALFAWAESSPVEERRVTESMSSQDWANRIQKLRTHNEQLESDYIQLQHQYEKSQLQKEFVRKKAKELADVMSSTFQWYIVSNE